MSQTLAAEWEGNHRIKVNCIGLGGIEGTEGIDRLAATEETCKKLINKIPSGHLGKDE